MEPLPQGVEGRAKEGYAPECAERTRLKYLAFLCCVFMLWNSIGSIIPAGSGYSASGTSWAAETEPASIRLIKATEAQQLLPAVVTLDARPRSVWAQGHIPGACSFSWEDYTRTDTDGVKYRTLPPAELAQALGEKGIGTTTDILIYADADTSWGGEGWAAWILAWLGHQGTVYILDGGIQTWQEVGLALKQGEDRCSETAKTQRYEVNLRVGLNISAQELERNKDRYTIVDTRNYWNEWLLGHIPDAVHINWEKFYAGSNRRPLDTEALKQLLKEKGVDPEKPVVYYCTGGIRSGYTWLVHTLAGLPVALNFEGGIEEWNIRTR